MSRLAAVVTVLHAVNAVAEIMTRSKKSGEAITMRHQTKLKLAEIAKVALPNAKITANATSTLIVGDPSAFYDCKEERWVLIFASYPNEKVPSDVTACLFVAVSYSIDPLDDWRVYALEARPQIAPGYKFASAGGITFHPYGAQVRGTLLILQRRRAWLGRGAAVSTVLQQQSALSVV